MENTGLTNCWESLQPTYAPKPVGGRDGPEHDAASLARGFAQLLGTITQFVKPETTARTNSNG